MRPSRSQWSYLEEGEGPGVTREAQPQHALQLGDGDMEGSSAGESLDYWLRQIGGEEAQLKPKHAELQNKHEHNSVIAFFFFFLVKANLRLSYHNDP